MNSLAAVLLSLLLILSPTPSATTTSAAHNHRHVRGLCSGDGGRNALGPRRVNVYAGRVGDLVLPPVGGLGRCRCGLRLFCCGRCGTRRRCVRS